MRFADTGSAPALPLRSLGISSGATRSITWRNRSSYTVQRRGSNRSPRRSTTTESSRRPSSSAIARSSRPEDQDSPRRQRSSSSLQVLANQQLQLFASGFGYSFAVGNQGVRQRRSALA